MSLAALLAIGVVADVNLQCSAPPVNKEVGQWDPKTKTIIGKGSFLDWVEPIEGKFEGSVIHSKTDLICIDSTCRSVYEASWSSNYESLTEQLFTFKIPAGSYSGDMMKCFCDNPDPSIQVTKTGRFSLYGMDGDPSGIKAACASPDCVKVMNSVIMNSGEVIASLCAAVGCDLDKPPETRDKLIELQTQCKCDLAVTGYNYFYGRDCTLDQTCDKWCAQKSCEDYLDGLIEAGAKGLVSCTDLLVPPPPPALAPPPPTLAPPPPKFGFGPPVWPPTNWGAICAVWSWGMIFGLAGGFSYVTWRYFDQDKKRVAALPWPSDSRLGVPFLIASDTGDICLDPKTSTVPSSKCAVYCPS